MNYERIFFTGAKTKYYILGTYSKNNGYYVVKCRNCKTCYKRSLKVILLNPDGDGCPKCINGVDVASIEGFKALKDGRKFKYGRNINGFIDRSIKIYKGEKGYETV